MYPRPLKAVRYIYTSTSRGGEERREYVTVDHHSTSYEPVVHPISIDYAEETGSLIINFGVESEGVEVLKSNALVIITLKGGKVADIEILLDDPETVKRLAKAFKPNSNW